MQRAQFAFPHLAIDPTRIVATSAAIAVHLLVLMLLMLPTQLPSQPAVEEEPPFILVPQTITKPKDPIAKFVPHQKPRPVTPLAQTHRKDSVVTPVDQTPTPVSTQATQQEPVHETNDFIIGEATPAFAQISADISPPPPYPQIAISRHLTGVVFLLVRVSASGEPLEVSIDGSSGAHVLDEAARKFVLARWHFVPATRGGQPIEAYARVPITFVLD